MASHVCLSPQCALVPDICFSTSKVPRCVNTQPGFHCLPCPPRYRGSQPTGVGLEAAKTEKQVRKAGLPCVLWRLWKNQMSSQKKQEKGEEGVVWPRRDMGGAGPGKLSTDTAWRLLSARGEGLSAQVRPVKVRPQPLSY